MLKQAPNERTIPGVQLLARPIAVRRPVVAAFAAGSRAARWLLCASVLAACAPDGSELAAIEQAAGRNDRARTLLEQAIDLEPANPESWRRLGALRMYGYDDPKGALSAYQAAFFLDPRSPQSTTDIVIASRLAAASGG